MARLHSPSSPWVPNRWTSREGLPPWGHHGDGKSQLPPTPSLTSIGVERWKERWREKILDPSLCLFLTPLG